MNINEFTFNIHGINVRLTTENSFLGDYVFYNLNYFKENFSRSDIDVIVYNREVSNFFDENRMYLLSKNLYLGIDEIVWIPEPWFKYKIKYNNNKIYIEAIIKKEPISMGILMRNLYNKMFKINLQIERIIYAMRYLIHFPVFMLLRKLKGIEVMHGSAVAKNNKAIVFAGYDCVGKSTLAIYFYMKKNYAFLNDNFLLFDYENVYAFPELVRLNLNKLTLDIPLKIKNKRFYAYGKDQFILENIQSKARSKLFCFNIFGNSDYIKEANKSDIINYILSMKKYLPEFIEYEKFLSLISLISGENNLDEQRFLERFLEGQKLLIFIKNKIENIGKIMEVLDNELQRS